MDDREFQQRVDEALQQLYRRVAAAADEHEIDVDFNAGTLAVEFEDPPAKFVVSPNAPVKQIWVSALTRSFKLSWDASRTAFVLPDTGETLVELMAGAISQQLGETITL